MEFYFNELSLESESFNKKVIFNEFVDVISDLKTLTKKVNIHYHIKADDLNPQKSLLTFISTLPEKQGGLKSFLLNQFTNNPIITYYPEYRFNGQECFGLGLAFENDSFSLSFATHLDWKQHVININEAIIDEIENSLLNSIVNVNNICIFDNLEFHRNLLLSKVALIEKMKQKDINNGRDLIANLHLFEHLELINEVKIIIDNKFTTKTAEFNDLLMKLSSLNDYFNSETVSPNAISNFVLGRPRQEFESRRKLINERINISFPDNVERDFYWHIDTYNSNGRIHFSPDFENKKCYIGYIGPKIV